MWIAGALVLLVTGWIYVPHRADRSAARETLPAGSQIASTSCRPIEYAVTGSGSALSVIHGAGGGSSQVSGMSERLADSGFTAIALSRFGQEQTSPRNGHLTTLVGDDGAGAKDFGLTRRAESPPAKEECRPWLAQTMQGSRTDTSSAARRATKSTVVGQLGPCQAYG